MVDGFFQADLSLGMPVVDGLFDAIILPSFNYYVPRESLKRLLSDCNRLLCDGGLFFIRSRTCRDYRFGRGREVEHNGFILECTETGEKDMLNVFYEPDELTKIIYDTLGVLSDCKKLHVRYENLQNGLIIANDDVIIWGRR